MKTTSVIRPIRPTLGVKKQPIPVENVPSETEKDEENEDYTRIPLVTESAKALRAVLNHPRFSSNSSSNLSESSSDEGPSKRIRIVSETSSRTTEVTKKVSSGGNQPVLTSKTNCKTSQLVMIRNTNTTNNPESSMMSLQYKCKLCAKMSTVYRNNIERHLRTIHNVVRSDRKEYDDFITNVLLPTPSGGTDHSETERSDATVCNVATTSGSKVRTGSLLLLGKLISLLQNCSGPHVNCQHCAKRKKAAQKLRDEVNDAIKPLQLLLKQIEKFC